MRRARRSLFATPMVVTTLAGTPACRSAGPTPRPMVPPAPELAPRDDGDFGDVGTPRAKKLPIYEWGSGTDYPEGTLVFVDPECKREQPGDAPWVAEECPEEGLPEPRPEHLVIDAYGYCTEVYREGDEPRVHGPGRVRCPDGGPTAELPATRVIPWMDTRLSISESSLRCVHEVYANPPYWERVEHCPPELLPRLINGEQPTERDPCRWHEIDVQCP